MRHLKVRHHFGNFSFVCYVHILLAVTPSILIPLQRLHTWFEKNDGLEACEFSRVNLDGLEPAHYFLQHAHVGEGGHFVSGGGARRGWRGREMIRQREERTRLHGHWPLYGAQQEQLAPRLFQQNHLKKYTFTMKRFRHHHHQQPIASPACDLLPTAAVGKNGICQRISTEMVFWIFYSNSYSSAFPGYSSSTNPCKQSPVWP